MEKKYKINVKIRKGFTDTEFADFELDNKNFCEAFQVNRLATFKDDAWIVLSLEEIPQEELEEAVEGVRGGNDLNYPKYSVHFSQSCSLFL